MPPTTCGDAKRDGCGSTSGQAAAAGGQFMAALDLRRSADGGESIPQSCLTLAFDDEQLEAEFQSEQLQYIIGPVKVLIVLRAVLNRLMPGHLLTYAAASPAQWAILITHHTVPWAVCGLLFLVPRLFGNQPRRQTIWYTNLLIATVLSDSVLESSIAGSNGDPFPAGPYIVAVGASLARLNWFTCAVLSFIGFALYWSLLWAFDHELNSLALSGCMSGFPLFWVVSRFCERSMRDDFWSRMKLRLFNKRLQERLIEFSTSAVAQQEHPTLTRIQTQLAARVDALPGSSSMAQLFATLRLADDVNELITKSERRQSLFLSTMSHELRTPLTVMSGCLDCLTPKYAGDDDNAELIQTMRDCSTSLLAIISDILDFSKLSFDEDSIVMEQTQFNPRKLVGYLCRTTKVQCDAKGVNFVVDTGSLTPRVRVVGDLMRMQQIFTNLLANAVKFTDRDGTVTLTVRDVPLACRTDNGTAGASWGLRVCVHDTGIGMSEATMRVIFAPFTQADASITRRYGGTGLGLTIANELSLRMGCTGIKVRSREGEFSEFTVDLPLAGRSISREADADDTGLTGGGMPEAGAPATASPSPAATATEGVGDTRVLVVEDNTSVQRVLCRQLQRAGFRRIDVADDGAAAVTMVELAIKKGRPFKLALMDLHMPFMNGLQATKQITSLGGRAPAIVGVTADVIGDVKERFLRAGAVAVLHKPVSSAALQEALDLAQQTSAE